MADQSSVFKADILKGKVALITGGATGINFGITKQLGTHGAKIAIMGRREQVLKSSCEQLTQLGVECMWVQGDVREYKDCEKAVQQVVDKWGKLDILVNGAAGNFLAPAAKLSSNGFKTVLMIDTVGTFNMSRAAYSTLARPQLASTAPAVILNVTASLHRPATPMQIHASAAKAGVDSMTRTLALEWGSAGIRVVGVSPGPIAATEGMSKLGGPDPTAVLQQVPLGRSGSVEDVARAALFLVSDAATWVTGTTIDVDGGWVVNRAGFSAKL
eukprot:TRINITY_DN10264_c0_g1_i1.p1 TRINITY_DN10264_c0_g1~~TRINITY_DN10264_c0_g1_i1.p1  ORF type:complete len:284 (+),score=91.49 TRINITY_DN10264_c0_g1_i1:37-852(+)